MNLLMIRHCGNFARFVVSSSGGGGGGAVVTADTLTMVWPGQEVAWSPASCLALVITTP